MLHYAAPLHGLSIRFERNEKEGYRRKKKKLETRMKFIGIFSFGAG